VLGKVQKLLLNGAMPGCMLLLLLLLAVVHCAVGASTLLHPWLVAGWCCLVLLWRGLLCTSSYRHTRSAHNFWVPNPKPFFTCAFYQHPATDNVIDARA